MAKEVESDSLTWNSIIDSKFQTFVIYPNNPHFKKFEDNYFKVFGLAFLDFQSMTIFVDGKELLKDGYTPDHIYAIEAHEIAHHMLKHDRDAPSVEQEKAADAAAIELLDLLKHQKAKDLLINRFLLLYKHDYSTDTNLSIEEKSLLKTYLKARNDSWWKKALKFIRIIKK